MIRIDQVSRTYRKGNDEVRALDDVSLSIPKGQFVSVRGPSGCGKTTLLMTLGAMLQPSAGRVLVSPRQNGTTDGEDIDLYALPQAERARFRAKRIGFVFQMFHLVPYLNVRENVLLSPVDVENKEDRATSLLEQLSLTSRAQHKPSELSAGERQRTAIARALLHQPDVLLADEPTGNLDPDNEVEVFRILSDYHRQGATVIVVTHGDAASTYADRLVYIENGKVTSDASTAPSDSTSDDSGEPQ